MIKLIQNRDNILRNRDTHTHSSSPALSDTSMASVQATGVRSKPTWSVPQWKSWRETDTGLQGALTRDRYVMVGSDGQSIESHHQFLFRLWCPNPLTLTPNPDLVVGSSISEELYQSGVRTSSGIEARTADKTHCHDMENGWLVPMCPQKMDYHRLKNDHWAKQEFCLLAGWM